MFAGIKSEPLIFRTMVLPVGLIRLHKFFSLIAMVMVIPCFGMKIFQPRHVHKFVSVLVWELNCYENHQPGYHLMGPMGQPLSA